ncbi:serine/threonine protein kinase [Pseudomonas carnis]|uniref:serine/threonine-protein kinase n=1 Tax=Pseudomonas carnis TaxID=2487355 RepID=UPI0018E5B419|nr:serine/threonine-protein kinase [Pseudomonas carnis]MBI6654964.1 serine/threonine protein kinase [Pseudomonas carnis]MBI6689645.1 serine/threonine protein kinase [Pseudomonas carnis]
MLQLPERYKDSGGFSSGGMGTVIFCEDTVLERKVAVKIIKNRSDHRRMLDELAALMKIRSKHVVQVYDFLKIDGFGLGIVQEYIDGEDLFEVVASRRPDTQSFYKDIWQLASGIGDIHSVGIIHRDIKPNNVKVDPEGVMKIFDFGLARNDGADACTMGFIGTHGFAAPELYSHAAEFTSAVDVYAFGATALFLGAGDLPKELLKSYQRVDCTDFFSILPFYIAPEIIEVLSRCLHPKPELRPAIFEVRDKLARHILYDMHQALVVYKGQAKHLGAKQRTITLSLNERGSTNNVGAVNIDYDGLKFFVAKVSGEVFINNTPGGVGYELPGSCVVALGNAQRESYNRAFITFDLSHPEIVL